MKLICDKMDFIEFKQNILLLKQPQHRASIFYDLKLDDFIRIRDFTESFSAIKWILLNLNKIYYF